VVEWSPRADRRDVHSFPTRRSSDLKDVATMQRAYTTWRRTLTVALGVLLVLGALGAAAPAYAQSDEAGTLVVSARAEIKAEPDIDRKSTRLNSSHVKISYAVFCLKK